MEWCCSLLLLVDNWIEEWVAWVAPSCGADKSAVMCVFGRVESANSKIYLSDLKENDIELRGNEKSLTFFITAQSFPLSQDVLPVPTYWLSSACWRTRYWDHFSVHLCSILQVYDPVKHSTKTFEEPPVHRGCYAAHVLLLKISHVSSIRLHAAFRIKPWLRDYSFNAKVGRTLINGKWRPSI